MLERGFKEAVRYILRIRQFRLVRHACSGALLEVDLGQPIRYFILYLSE